MHERGNILFLILLAVVLFAALSYAVTQSTNGGVKNASPEKMQLAVSQLLQDAALMEQTVNRLRLAGCSEVQISFENAPSLTDGRDYSNPSAPLDKHCHVFDPAGGGMSWKTPPKDILNPDDGALALYGQYHISNNSRLIGIGTALTTPEDIDLIMFVGYVTDEACLEINKRTGLGSGSIQDNAISLWDGGRFRGTYGTPGAYSWLSGDRFTRTGCAKGNSSYAGGAKRNSFFQVLIAR